MNVDNVKRKSNKDRSVGVYIRISQELSDWLKKKDFSPTAVFLEAVKELGYEGK